MSGHDRNLTPGQLRALGVLLTGGTAGEAAAAAGRDVRTLRRWQASPEFSDALREFARSGFRDARSQLLAAQTEAVQVLWQALRTGSSAEKIRAARTILELGLKAAEDDYDERLERLEVAAWRQLEPGGQHGLRILSS